MPEHHPTAPTRAEAASILNTARDSALGEATGKVAINLLAIALVTVVQALFAGTWFPTWWAWLLIGISLPDLGRALWTLLALETHQLVFYAETCDGTRTRGCGRRDCPNEVMPHD